MSAKRAAAENEDDRPPMVIVDEADLVWDDELGYHRCPLGLIQTPRAIVGCRECDSEGGLKLYVQQLEREGICDVVVVAEDEHEVWLQAVTCGYEHLRARYPRLIVMHYRWYRLPPLDGRSLIDAETGEEVWVHRWGNGVRAGGLASLPESGIEADPETGTDRDLDAATDPDLDIPF